MNKQHKKADLAINTVVIVILALVVLIVLLYIFGKQSSVFRYNLIVNQNKACANQQQNAQS